MGVLEEAKSQIQRLQKEKASLQTDRDEAIFKLQNARLRGEVGANALRQMTGDMSDGSGNSPKNGDGLFGKNFGNSECHQQLKRCMELSMQNQSLLDKLFEVRGATDRLQREDGSMLSTDTNES